MHDDSDQRPETPDGRAFFPVRRPETALEGPLAGV